LRNSCLSVQTRCRLTYPAFIDIRFSPTASIDLTASIWLNYVPRSSVGIVRLRTRATEFNVPRGELFFSLDVHFCIVTYCAQMS
jgi:hypothetical protein